MMQENKNQKTVVVLGVARSGTSTFAGTLQILGVNLGAKPYPQAVVPKGSFEDPDFAKIIEEIYRSALKTPTVINDGIGYWKNIPSPNQIESQREKFREKIKTLIDKKSKDKQIWGWKHPATTLTIELFLPYLTNPHFVIVLRNPLDVVRSSQEFFKIKKIKQIDFSQMLKAVNYHNGEIIKFLERHPELPRIFVSFEDVIKNPIKEAKRLADFLGLELTDSKVKQIKKFVIPREKIKREKKKAAIKNKLRLVKRGFQVISEDGWIVFFRKGFKVFSKQIKPLNKFLEIFTLPIYLLKVKKFKYENLNQLVDFSFRSSLIKPYQIKEEILELLKILEKRKPKTILEIGTANGGTLFLFSQIAPEDATIISIDLPGGKFGGGYPKWKIPLYRAFTKKNQKIYLIRADSHKQETLERVRKILGDKKVDFLFIDGDHSYEGVKKDFEMYSGLVERERVIALHDIVYHPYIPECQVNRFWKEIKQRYKTKEIISSQNQTWAGIGVIYN